jgi:hypothetical protein
MAVLTPQPKMQFLTAAGVPLVGGKVFTYTAGTTTPAVTYVDSAQTTPNTNPVILDSRGEANIWLGAAAYKFKLTDANDVEIWTVDYISAPTSGVSPALSGNVTIDSDTPGPALKITQIGTGLALRVQDSADPDATPTVVDNVGNVGIGTATPAVPLDVAGAGRMQSLTLTSAPLPVASGGTGRNTLTANNVVLGNGTSAVGLVAPGTSGDVLTSDGTTWASTPPVEEVAAQTGNAGKLLTTNGTATAWSTDSVVRARGSLLTLTTTPTVGTGAVNIASVTAGATGVYTVTFTTSLASANYQVFATVTTPSAVDDNVIFCTDKATGNFILRCYRGGTAAATGTVEIDVMVVGGW